MNMKINTNNSLRQTLIPSLAMQQAFFVLQLPQLELAEWLHLQIEQNPLLEYKEEKGSTTPALEEKELDFSQRDFGILDYLDETFTNAVFPETQESSQEETLSYSISLGEHLMTQAKDVFSSSLELSKAETVIGNLDHRGFLGDVLVDEDVLKVIQTFDPPGIAARDLQQSLLIQLEARGQKKSLLYVILSQYFQDLLQNKFPDLEKKLRIPSHTLKKTLQKDLFSLDFQPGAKFTSHVSPPIIPDVFLYKIAEEWTIEINETHLPQITISEFSSTPLSSSEKEYFRLHTAKGKWLLHIIRRRNTTLKRIAHYLLKHQQHFFNGALNQLVPLNMQDAAKELDLNASTIARATAHKYIAAPHGVFSMRNFFSHAFNTSRGKTMSHHTVKNLLLDLIAKENKSAPLSDDRIVTILSSQGIQCARRTITKYRKCLHIPSSQQRKN
jgi:RNA polymerase sigma-54 factor